MIELLRQSMKKHFRRFRSKADIEKQFEHFPSFSEKLGFEEWSEEERCFLLQDCRSVARIFEVRDVPMDARPEKKIADFHEMLTRALSNIIPSESVNPWVLQSFVQNEVTLQPLKRRLENYVPKHLKDDPLTQDYLAMMADHFSYMSKEKGMFIDPLSGVPFQGKTKRIRLVLYRRYSQVDAQQVKQQKKNKKAHDPIKELNTVTEQFTSRLQTLGIKVRTLKGKQIYDWLVRWFNPRPERTGGSTDQLLKRFPYPGKDKKPFGWNMGEAIFFNEPKSTATTWQFDDKHHKVMLLNRLESVPEIGAVTRERKQASNLCYALLDKLPEGSVFSTHIAFEDNDHIEKHLTAIEKSAIGWGGEQRLIKEDIAQARYEIKNGNRLFRATHAIYYSGDTLEELESFENLIMNELSQVNLTAIRPEFEKNPLDMYLRFLPMNYDYGFEKKKVFRSTYQYATDIAALLPFYGRSRGDGVHPLFTLFNRGGEAFMFDPYHKDFKTGNSHMFVVGGTGAGKSVFINTVVLPLLAVKNARVFIIEAGGSFDLLTEHVRELGKKVTQINFKLHESIPINPFAEAYLVLEQLLKEEASIRAQDNVTDPEGLSMTVAHQHAKKNHLLIDSVNQPATKKDKKQEEERDLMSEMLMALRNMITGGIAREEANFSLADYNLLTEVFVEAIKNCKAKNIPQILTQHIQAYFEEKSKTMENPHQAKRLGEMALALKSFITVSKKAKFFNRPSKPLEDSDYMQINLGFLQDTQDNDNMTMMSLLMISLLSKILAIADANQRSDRPTILIIDEAHIPMKNPLVSAFLVLMSKVARKLGLWLVPVTQNVKDFNDVESKKVLSMIENWLCLALAPDEIANVEKLRELSPEQHALIMSVKKYPGLYSEGVLLSAREEFQGLFRNIPPRYSLAMAMTEQHEKKDRQHLMDTKNISEMQAVKIVGEQLKNKKVEVKEDEGFDD